ncbi:HIV Tat-specific factor 1 [Nymphon striatum]|nr:HIV Tat-specific factor 1 [Nymphon striatum]
MQHVPSPADWGWTMDADGKRWVPVWRTLDVASKACKELHFDSYRVKMAQDEFEMQLKLQKEADQQSQNEYTDQNDGSKYEWNAEKKAWFPKIDEDFLATYLSNYGTNAHVSEEPKTSEDSKSENQPDEMKPPTSINEDDMKGGQKRKADEESEGLKMERHAHLKNSHYFSPSSSFVHTTIDDLAP